MSQYMTIVTYLYWKKISVSFISVGLLPYIGEFPYSQELFMEY